MSDKITILRHPMSAMAKTWNADGTITGYGDAKYFSRREADVENLTELSGLLAELEGQSTTVLIRGRYVGDRLARERDGTEYKPGKVRRALDYFDDQPLHAIMLDIDSWSPMIWDPLTHPQLAIDEYLQSELPAVFAGAGYHWQLSNSHGHASKGATLSAHVWMWSREPYTSAQLKAYAQEQGLMADVSLFNPVQAHYTAAPVFDGVDDPLAAMGVVRSGYESGVLGDELELDLSTAARAAVGGASGGREQRMRELAGTDPVVQVLESRGMIKSYARGGALNIVCPFEDEHSSVSAESATQYFLANTGGHAVSQFKCLHAHCVDRRRGEFLARLGIDEMAVEFEDLSDGDGDETGEDTQGGMGDTVDSNSTTTGKKAKTKSSTAAKHVPQAQHLCTDLANANRVAKYFGKKLIVVADNWYTWSGKHWVREEGDVWRDTALLSKLVKAEEAQWRAKPTSSTDEMATNLLVAEALKKWSTKCEAVTAMSAAIKILKMTLSVSADSVDKNQWLLNCSNGTVDLRTGLLQPHNPDDRITKLIELDYDPAARAPTWEAVVAKITLEDYLGASKPVVAFLKRWFGYCATGSVREHKFLVHYGQGSNGKSTMLDTVAAALGSYAGTAAPGLMMASRGDKHPTEIADLYNMRMMTAHETGDGGLLREDFVKQATGGDKMKARYMRADFFEFTPTHKLQLLTNHKPQVKGQDNGIWRRILLVPYQARFGSAEELVSRKAHYLKDTRIAEHLHAELQGVLTWIVEGAVEWYRDGLQEPDIVRLASDDYQGEQDRVRQFVEECCQAEKDAETPFTGDFGIFEAYREWCREGGFAPMSKQRLKGELERVLIGLEFTDQRRWDAGGTRRQKQICKGLRLLDN